MNIPEINKSPFSFKARKALVSIAVGLIAVGIPTIATGCSGRTEEGPRLHVELPRQPYEKMTPGNMKKLVCLTVPEDMLRDIIKQGADTIISEDRVGGKTVVNFNNNTIEINGYRDSLTDYCGLDG